MRSRLCYLLLRCGGVERLHCLNVVQSSAAMLQYCCSAHSLICWSQHTVVTQWLNKPMRRLASAIGCTSHAWLSLIH